MTNIASPIHKHFPLAPQFASKQISGIKLTTIARKREKEKKGDGVKLLHSYVPDLSNIQIKRILKRKYCLVGISVYFYAIDTNNPKWQDTLSEQKYERNMKK